MTSFYFCDIIFIEKIGEDKMYKVPKNGATVTIYAPYDCENNCPFCINKKDYKNREVDMEKVIKSIIRIDKITPNCDFVISGGEPLADLDKFEQIIQTISRCNSAGSRHRVYVNTTFPIHDKKEVFRLNKFSRTINFFNISRYINNYIDEKNDIYISYLRVPVRITCLLYKKEEGLWVKEILDRYKGFSNITDFQFRDNYSDVGYDNLYNSNYNEYLNNLLKGLNKNIFDCEFIYKSYAWDCVIDPNITFHRGMRNTCITYPRNITEINDIIITQDGEILDDWIECGQPLNLKNYRKALKNEKNI